MRLIADLETNGLLDVVSVIHCLVLIDADTEEVYPFRPHQIEEGIAMLRQAEQMVWHNGIGYDMQVFRKLYREDFDYLRANVELRDTLVESRVVWPEIKKSDLDRIKKGTLPGNMMGRHSLESWGHRLGLMKGDYSKEMKEKGLDPWAEFNESMLDYCIQDCWVTLALSRQIDRKRAITATASRMEHEVAWVLTSQMQTGYPFDEEAAKELYITLAAEREELRHQCQEAIRPWYKPVFYKGRKVVKCPKVSNSKHHTTKDAEWCPVELVTFNPGSDIQVADRLQKLHGWKPQAFTSGGQPSCTEEVLKVLKYPEAKLIARYRLLDKRVSQLAEGKSAWLKEVKQDGRIYGYINQNGCVTGRGAHSRPNLGQVPAKGKPYGEECRKLFYVPKLYKGKRYVQLGTDMSGLELRCLGHYMARYDGGAYIDAVLNGDIHWVNVMALGLIPAGTTRDPDNPDHEKARDIAKRFIYAWLYGAGPETVGALVGKGKQGGLNLISRFLERIPALAALKAEIAQKKVPQGYITALDGRFIPIRSAHAALNSLLQSAGAVLCKQWMVEFHSLVYERTGLVLGEDYWQLAWVHDELQLMVPEEMADEIGSLSITAAERTGVHFGLRCPTTAAYAAGSNWAECH